MHELLLEPEIQFGFIGFSALLLGVVVWQFNQLLIVLKANNRIIAANTAAINEQAMALCDLLKLDRSIHDKLISRPCIAKGEQQ